jgi:hypothetical protein
MNTSSLARILRTWPRCSVAALLVSTPLAGQNNHSEWSKPFPPHKVIGNVYFVGSVNLGSYLITTPEGHIWCKRLSSRIWFRPLPGDELEG